MAIKLEKQGDSHRIDLSKKEDSNIQNLKEEIIINLNWSNPQQSKWSKFLSGDKAIDLDLGCWYELNNGKKSCIDGLQFSHGRGGGRTQLTAQGSYNQAPWIWHSGDDRSGSVSEGENIFLNPQGITDLKRITIYSYIYDGVAKWADSNAVVTIKVPNNPDIIVEMGKQNSPKKFCAIAEIVFDDNSMTVKKLVTFHDGHADCDRAYNWGMNWRAGSK